MEMDRWKSADQRDGWENGTGWKNDGKIKGRKPRRKIKVKKDKGK